ncbi:tandem-95 repeat protein [Aureibaculum marinum]|uniref:Tandem-95 repeat protein n=1 Tax=Aureibaculum marinum TaxID=2487930 RepID=A0A3N4NMD4_9FLAO|nr:endonuclease [Aureibaculum marinum]RPD96715.1 tandem-95 repeat protein [Aureibaculum marinum]
MKNLVFLLFISLFFINCSSDSGNSVTPNPDPDPEIKKPVAVNDNFEATEDTPLILSNLLTNDTDLGTARITSFDSSSTNNGTIVDNRNNTYTYTPPKGYVGSDTFTYTICDRETPENCSTATVTITVIDEGSPTAIDDNYSSTKNTTRTFSDFLDNDDLLDNATLSSIDTHGTLGTVTLNENGSITYVPANDYIGEDSFTYTICDDDSPTATCSTATITVTILETIAFNIPTELVDYYSDLGLTTNKELNYELLKNHTTEKHTTILSYGERHNYLYNADADLIDTDSVVLMYSGVKTYWKEYTSNSNTYSPQTFNTEHIYPQSLLSSTTAVTDLHHLRSCNDAVNSSRSNHPFTEGSGTYKLDNEKWYPGDDWKGDVARMVMYLNIRYGEKFEKVGSLELFLKWNREDPVSDFEIQRNNVIEAAQGNRNPFIDNPYMATLIWGGTDAENTWE